MGETMSDSSLIINYNNKAVGEQLGLVVLTRNAIKQAVEENYHSDDYNRLKSLYEIVAGSFKHADGTQTLGYRVTAQLVEPDSAETIKAGRVVSKDSGGTELSAEGQLLSYLQGEGIRYPRTPNQIAELLKERPLHLDLVSQIQDYSLPLKDRLGALQQVHVSRKFTVEEIDGFLLHIKERYLVAEIKLLKEANVNPANSPAQSPK